MPTLTGIIVIKKKKNISGSHNTLELPQDQPLKLISCTDADNEKAGHMEHLKFIRS